MEKTLREITERVKAEIGQQESSGMDLNSRSFGYEEGILLSVNDAKVLLEAIEEKWIKVSERLPEEGVYVLCQRTQTSMGDTKYITPTVGKLINEYKFSCEMDWVNVTHWQPLPSPPKKGAE